jgi:hypothetical protein
MLDVLRVAHTNVPGRSARGADPATQNDPLTPSGERNHSIEERCRGFRDAPAPQDMR